VAPLDIFPLSNIRASLVTVWTTESLFVQTTLVPAVISIVGGTKANPLMVIEAVGGCVDVVCEGVGCVAVAPEVQPATMMKTNTGKSRTRL